MSAQLAPPDARYWVAATWSVGALLVLQAAVFGVSVAIIDLDSADWPLRAFVITTGVSAALAVLLLPRATGLRHAVARAALATAVIWALATLFEVLLYSNAGIVW